jgi:hypothetical protein
MNTSEFNSILESIGAKSHGSNLSAGTIYWTDENHKVVAHANIKAIISWASTNNSAMWACYIGQFQDNKVPVIQPENVISEYIGNITDSETELLAIKTAEGDRADYLYRASNGSNGLYMGIYNFKKEYLELTPEDLKRKRKASVSYITQMISNIGELLENKKKAKEAEILLTHFHESLNEKIKYAFRDEDLKEEAIKLQKSLNAWTSMLPDKRKDVLAFMKQAISRWNRL